MIKKTLINKPRGLYGKLLIRIEEIILKIPGLSAEKTIPWAYVYEKLGRNFAIKKSEIREALFVLRDFQLIEVSPRGIKLCYNIK